MKQMTNLLGLYGGCDTDELKRIRKLPSRWVCLSTSFPTLVIYESGCYLLHDDDGTGEKGVKHKPSQLAGSKRGREAIGEGGGDGGGKEQEGEPGEDGPGY